ncbi:MarR family transcriptional regulator [Mycobacterium sp.]|uniref:MarR family transcriptional regulator n=1 Tax=Mycobacterium sp. TaxID=1785 RepID=UPI0039C9F8D9
MLATSKQPATFRDIASRLGCDPSTVSLEADKLDQAGLIARQPHPTERPQAHPDPHRARTRDVGRAMTKCKRDQRPRWRVQRNLLLDRRQQLVGDAQCPIRRLGPPVACDERQLMLACSCADQTVVERATGQARVDELP